MDIETSSVFFVMLSRYNKIQKSSMIEFA